MIDERAWPQLYVDRKIPVAGQELLQQIRSAEPSRRLHSGRGKLYSRFPSDKMGWVLQAADDLHLAYLILWEHDDGVLEVWDQPPALKLTYLSAGGKKTANLFSPPYFMITDSFIGWVEVQSEEYLEKQAQRSPHRYTRSEDGTWTSPPGDEYAATYGLSYHVISSSQINQTLVRNTMFLTDFYHPSCSPVDEAAAECVIGRVVDEPSILLIDLLTSLDGASSADVYKLIANRRIYVNLETDLLAEQDRVRCFRDIHLAQAYSIIEEPIQGHYPQPQMIRREVNAIISWDGRPWRIANIGETAIILISPNDPQQSTNLSHALFEEYVRSGQITGLKDEAPHEISPARQILKQALPKQMQAANKRHRILQLDPKLHPLSDEEQRLYKSRSERTKRRWRRAARLAEQAFNDPYVGLLSDRGRTQGNRTPRYPPELWIELDAFLEECYFVPEQPTLDVARQRFILRYSAKPKFAGVPPIGEKTFARKVAERSTHKNRRAREGDRGAYDSKPTTPFYWYLGPGIPPHGDYYGHIGHIDHTQLEEEVMDPKTGKSLGRPWVSFLTCARTRRKMAIYQSLDPPSYRTNMMLLRICVARNGFLPAIIVADGGKDFHGEYLETLLARYRITLRTRPPNDPRYGNVIERLFGITQQQFIHQLLGNTKATKKDVRTVTEAVNPKNLTVWVHGRLYARVCQFGYEIYDQMEHSTLGMSPRDAWARSIALCGIRETRLIAFDEDFVLDTMPTTDKGTARIVGNGRVKINRLYYHHPAMQDHIGADVHVRYDPFDAGIAYAYIEKAGGWIRCESEYYYIFRGMAERQIEVATAELRQRKRLHNRQISGRILALFIEEVKLEEKELSKQKELLLFALEQKRAAENRLVNVAILGKLMPFSGENNAPPGATGSTRGPVPGGDVPGDAADIGDSDEEDKDGEDTEDIYGTY